jgi:hypothetical protein
VISKLSPIINESNPLCELNSEHFALLNFSAKDFCSLSDIKEKRNIFNRFKEFNKNNQKLSETIYNFKGRYTERKDLTETDLKIYDLLREEFK